MDFSVAPTQQAFLETVDRFIARHLPPGEVRRRDAHHIPPYDLMPVMGEAGFFRLALPPEHGGLGQDWTSVALVQERLGFHAYMAASIMNRVVGFGIASVLGYGSAAQKAALLPRLAEGRLLISLALTEPGAGTDAGAVATRAERTSAGWRITGRKTWISDAGGADFLLVVARDGEGISLLLVPPTTPGIAMTPLPKIGNNAMPSWDIGLDGAEVPEDALIGERGRGFRHLMSTLHASRASMAATVTGCAQAAVDCALAHAKERVQFGRPIGANQAIRHRLAEMQMRVDQSRLTMRHLAWLIATGRPCRREAAQAKIIATDCLQDVTHHGMQILASAGYAADSDMQRYWRDARLYSFGEGTNEILRDLVAREMGLPT
ncbi:acyl-CoA dehydrogenase family protein [Roseomonas sp. AR75]|uniref:acyl-CoA dehydrogenase family protein n=1 Tax=Roseomonas sp. AR75 TaxID=2562311 RepID=UPI0010C01FC2|nr:acyl-CoA dehydrogenase family protein [Roseomonas sp. AR75]